MAVRVGYKQTEVGAIPVDWEVKALGNVVGIFRGASPRPINSPVWFDQNSSFGWVRISDVTRSRRRLQKTTQKLSDAGVRRSRFVSKNSLIMSIAATVGRPIVTDMDVCIHDGFVVLEHPQMSQDFLYYVLVALEKEWSKSGQTGSQMNLNTGIIKQKKIPLPPTKTEQEAIVEVLSDTDVLIEELEQLIAKKRDIQRAAMQQLLTGKTRLPGFSGEWEVRPLSSVAPLQRGFDLPTSQLKSGPHPVVYSNGVLNYHCIAMVRGPGVVTGRSGTLGQVNYIEADYWPHNTSLWVTNFKGNFPRFVYYLYSFIGLERFRSGSGVPTLNRNDVHHYSVGVPCSLPEQTAIATILSDMDAEIMALEERRDKTKLIKEGMMQELLTGKTRLI